MESYMIIGLVIAFIVVAFLLGLRDKFMARRVLLDKLKRGYGQEPKKQYKSDDMDHVGGFYKNHPHGFQIDDTTWNDLNMDGVYKRLNYCLSAAGEEYLYYMLRTPRQEDDFAAFEEQVEYLMDNHEDRRNIQLIFSKIGSNSRYSIYDYMNYLENVKNVGNGVHFIFLALLVAFGVLSFFSFGIGFAGLMIVMVAQIVSYFRIKSDIDPYLVTYGYIMRVVSSVDKFSAVKQDVFKKDMEELKEIAADFSAFKRGAGLLLSASNTGNPLDLLMDYFKMVTHIDLIKFNQMYRVIMDKRDKLDKILAITGRLEAEISVACFRASFKDKYVIPEFTEKGYQAKELIHPLIDQAVPNDISARKGVLLTGSNASGKSTFLKTCAINTILAQSVHTVLGSEYKAPLYRIYSSMALKDDIFEGDSYYIVEIKSIKRILDATAEAGNKVLCFVDEVLRGTNTIERIAASTQILKKLAHEKVECFAATHDIELTSLLKDEYEIYHFEGDVTDNDVRFDYKLKDGPATTRNAIKLLGVLGYEASIVKDAQSMADEFLETGNWKI